MDKTEFQAFLAAFIGAYYNNSQSTRYPDTFLIPSDDFNGLATAADETFPLKTKLERIKEVMHTYLMDGREAKVLPLAYAQKANNADYINSGTGFNRYVLYCRADSESIRMDIPNDFLTTVYDTVEGFFYSSAAYGSFSGVKAYRPREVLYFDF